MSHRYTQNLKNANIYSVMGGYLKEKKCIKCVMLQICTKSDE